MAVITPTYKVEAAGVRSATWAALSQTNPTGKPVQLAKYPDKSIDFFGTFGGGTMTLEGTNDERGDPDHTDHASAVWDGLEDLNGAAISITADDGEGVGSNRLWMRPVLTGATAGSVTAALVGRK